MAKKKAQLKYGKDCNNCLHLKGCPIDSDDCIRCRVKCKCRFCKDRNKWEWDGTDEI